MLSGLLRKKILGEISGLNEDHSIEGGFEIPGNISTLPRCAL